MKPLPIVSRASGAAILVLALVFGGLPRHATASPSGNAGPAVGLRVVYTQRDNVFLLDTASGVITQLTTRGGRGDIVYPRYAWSRDGRYLLLVRGHLRTQATDLLLLDRNGTVLRTLASLATTAVFRPSWAADADLVAYVASATPSAAIPGTINRLQSVDPSGRRAPLWSFGEPTGCGGGTSDPSEQLEWEETGFGSLALTFTWFAKYHLAVYTNSLCVGSVLVTDTRTGSTGPLGSHPHAWHEGVLSPDGTVVAAMISSTPERTIVLAMPRPGAVGSAVAPGELPAWSRDGRALYFVRRTPGPLLHMRDSFGNATDSQTYTTAIWRSRADGSGLQRISSFDAFGTGPLQFAPDGRSLVFARVDNSWALWRHRLAGDLITDALRARYGPRVTVTRLGLDGRLISLAADAGQPAVQP
jgi:WD40-like Beta Propeller Repeat